MPNLLLVALVFVAVLFPFVVVPEILERWGFDPKSRFVRLLVWSVFLILVLLPAALAGSLWTSFNLLDAFVLFAAVLFAVVWEYHRLHPGAFP